MAEKPHMNIVFIGHVDHGKSTTIGRLLLDTGHIQQYVIDKFKEEAASKGKTTFEFAWVMDQLKEERERGVTIDVAHNSVVARSAEPGYERRLELATGVRLVSVLPAPPVEDGEPRRFVLYPGGTPPRIGVEMANVRGARRIIRIDPITGVPEVERLPSP